MDKGCKTGGERRACPYCDAEIAEASFPYCTACEVKLATCPKCHKAVARDAQACPHCGAKLKRRP